MDSGAKPIDVGTAYGRRPGTYDRELTEVGAGTPMGELLRRYWHPIALAADAAGMPKRIRALGEDLILFRDGKGRPGLVVERCTHRGASLYYGRIEAAGIRCCYHGWLFGVDGQCLDKAVEADGGDRRPADRQPWYPVQERYGLIFAYMGPPEKKPALPKYANLEDLKPTERYAADDTSYEAGGPAVLDFNWLQHYENFQDAGHVIWLHFLHSGNQFGDTHRLAGAKIDSHEFLKGRTWHATPTGMKYVAVEKLTQGREMRFIVQNVLPTVGIVPEPGNVELGVSDQVHWMLPIDDGHLRVFAVRKVDADNPAPLFRFLVNGKIWDERTEDERRKHPGDYEAQKSQGRITLHSLEHLSESDRGVSMLRRLLKQQLKAMRDGKDPINIGYDENAPPIRVEAGRFVA